MTKKRKLRPADKAKRVFWGIDTEFLQAGRTDEGDVHSIQIHDGYGRGWCFAQKPFGDTFQGRHGKEALWAWLQWYKPKTLCTWTPAPEFGSLKAWHLIGGNPYNNDLERVQRFWIEWKGKKGGVHRTLVYDIQPYFKQMRYKHKDIGSVEMAGEFLSDFYNEDLRKLSKPLGKDFGERAPETLEEWEYFRKYGLRDAQICSRAARWLQEEIVDRYIPGVDLRKLYSFGTIARFYFNLPKINPKQGRLVFIRRSHEHIHDEATFAGRNEAPTTGYLGDAFYNDISSLYPIVISWLNALEIKDVRPLTQAELDQISKPGDIIDLGVQFGWLLGDFQTGNDRWGLPIRGASRNYYVTGFVPYHLYNTLDLLAAKVKIHKLYGGYLPIFEPNKEQRKYIDLTFKKLEGRYASVPEKYCIKGVLNSLSGKLGQCEPLSMTSNFPAYSTLLAGSHYIDSRILDMINQKVYYMDTDSFFTEKKIEGKMFDLFNEKYGVTIPVLMDVKGESQPPGTIIFRAKHYYQNPHSSAFHAWKGFQEDWFKIVRDLPTGITVERQIKKTFRNRDKKARELRIGRWKVIRERYTSGKLAELFRADDKRIRKDFNSYRLAQEGRSIDSRAWAFKELALYSLHQFKETWLLKRDLKLRDEIFTEEYVNNFKKLYAERQAKVLADMEWETSFFDLERVARRIFDLD